MISRINCCFAGFVSKSYQLQVSKEVDLINLPRDKQFRIVGLNTNGKTSFTLGARFVGRVEDARRFFLTAHDGFHLVNAFQQIIKQSFAHTYSSSMMVLSKLSSALVKSSLRLFA